MLPQWPEFQGVTAMMPQDCVRNKLGLSATLQETFSNSPSIWYRENKSVSGTQSRNECNFLEIMLSVCDIKFPVQRSILMYMVQMKLCIFLNNFLFCSTLKKTCFMGWLPKISNRKIKDI